MKLSATHKMLVVLVLFCRVTALSADAADGPRTLSLENEGHRLKVQFPQTFQKTEQKSANSGVTQYAAGVSGEGQYMLTHQDFPDIDFSGEGRALRAANILLDSFVERAGAKLLSRRTIAVPGKPNAQGIAYELSKGDLRFRAQAFILGHRWYIVFVEGDQQFVNSSTADAFLKSARVTPPRTSVSTATPARTIVRQTASRTTRTNLPQIPAVHTTSQNRSHVRQQSASSSGCQDSRATSGYRGRPSSCHSH